MKRRPLPAHRRQQEALRQRRGALATAAFIARDLAGIPAPVARPAPVDFVAAGLALPKKKEG